MEQQFKLPILFHNLKYNAPFLIKEVDPPIHGEVTAIPQQHTSTHVYLNLHLGSVIYQLQQRHIIVQIVDVEMFLLMMKQRFQMKRREKTIVMMMTP